MAKKKALEADVSLIVGRNPVREALERRPAEVEKVMLQKGAAGRPVDAIRRAASEAGVAVQYVPPQRLERLAPGLNHQGALAIAAPVAYHDLDDLLTRIAPDLDAVRRKKPVLLVLDGIEDPFNFGAMLRSAVAAGADGVVVPKDRMAPLNAAALKASAGTATRIPVARTGNLAEAIEQLKERGYWIAGAAGDGETSVWAMDWDRPIALVIGSEHRGLRPRVAAACDYHVAIPLRGPVESLNASVAAGVLLFAAARVRGDEEGRKG